MGMWDRFGGVLIGVMTRDEIDQLKAYAEGLIRLTEYGLRSCSWVDGSTTGNGMWFPGDLMSDGRIAAITRRHVADDSADWEVVLRGPDCLSAAAGAARRVGEVLPEHGGVVLLSGAVDVRAWRRLIGDVIAAIGSYASGKCPETKRKARRTADWLESLLPSVRIDAELGCAS